MGGSTRRRASIPAAAAVLLLVIVSGAARPGAASPHQTGRWLAPFSEDGDGDGVGDFSARPPQTRSESARLPTAVNVVVVPDGRVLYWSQLDGSESVERSIAFEQPVQPRSRTRMLDLSSYFSTGETPLPPSAWSVPQPEDAGGGDLVGTDQRLLPDGRALAVGGTEWANDKGSLPVGRTELYGLASARVYSPGSGTWTQTGSMSFRRYYPSMVTLPSGALLVAGGAERLIYNSAAFPGAHAGTSVFPENVSDVETYDPASGTWTLGGASARAEMVLFAHLHLMPDGSVFHPAVGMIFPPGGADKDMAEWSTMRSYDPSSQTWRDAGASPLGVRGNGFSVLMPLRPPYDRARILVGGGTVGQWPGSDLATPVTEEIAWDAAAGSVERSFGSTMTTGRWHSSAVLLPSGELIAVSGADKDEVIDPGSGIPVRHAEMLDPSTGQWTRLASAARDRTLHNTAVLLRDASILVGGHSPAPAHYGAHTQNAPGLSNNFKDPSFEIFQPPYLFRGSRPVISGVSVGDGSVVVDTPDAANSTLQVVLSRLPSTTHVIDNDQRTVVLEHQAVGGSARAVLPGANVVPPGSYYLFVLKDNGQGPTPSVAEIVRIEG